MILRYNQIRYNEEFYITNVLLKEIDLQGTVVCNDKLKNPQNDYNGKHLTKINKFICILPVFRSMPQVFD